MSRDPSEEWYGTSFHTMISNNTTNQVDFLGLWGICQLGTGLTGPGPAPAFARKCNRYLFFCGTQNCTNCCQRVYTPGPVSAPQTNWHCAPQCEECEVFNPPAAPACSFGGTNPLGPACSQAVGQPTHSNCLACCAEIHGAGTVGYKKCLQQCGSLP